MAGGARGEKDVGRVIKRDLLKHERRERPVRPPAALHKGRVRDPATRHAESGPEQSQQGPCARCACTPVRPCARAPVRPCTLAPLRVRVRVRDQGEVEGCAGDEREDDDLFQSLQAWKGGAADWASQHECMALDRACSTGRCRTCDDLLELVHVVVDAAVVVHGVDREDNLGLDLREALQHALRTPGRPAEPREA